MPVIGCKMKAVAPILSFFCCLNLCFAQTEETTNEVSGILCARIPDTEVKLFLPLKSTDVKMEVTAGIVSAQVSQQFVNNTKYPLEAVYVFPLPSKATVTDMTLIVGDRMIRSVVKERVEAKKTYESAKKAGKKAALLEQERPNIFTTSVANFMPGETAKVSFSYMQPADYSKGVYSITFPMVVGQRYIPFKQDVNPDGSVHFASAVPDAHRLNPPLLHPTIDPGHRVSIVVDLHGLPVEKITSNTHAIRVEQPDISTDDFTVSLAQEVTLPDSEFNLKVNVKKNKEPAISFVNSRGAEASHGMLTVLPPLGRRKAKNVSVPRDVIFLVDTSGSMSGQSISQAKAGLSRCLKMLRKRDRFTIVRFASEFSSFAPDLREVTGQRLQAATTYVAGLSADGGTEMQKALEYVLGIKGIGKSVRLIVFLTDGCVGNEDSLMRLLSQKLDRARLFCFGIGSAPNEHLVRKMAETGRGQARFIRSHEDIGEVMADFFRTLEKPILTDISLEWLDSTGNRIENIEFYPKPCPDVFSERPLQVIARYPNHYSGRVIVSGFLNTKEVRYEYQVNPGQGTHHPAIDKMFGRSRINELMVQMICKQPDGKPIDPKLEIIRTALEYQLVSKYTSRIAVEEQIERKPDGTLVTVNVPAMLPNGWSPSAWFPTATNDPLLLALGIVAFMTATLLYFAQRKKAYAKN